jgi:ribonuclease R
VELPAEGFVHISALSDDYYRYDRAGHVISGFRSGNEYRLGDLIRVAVAAVDVDARELDFRLLGRSDITTEGKRRAKGAKRLRERKPQRRGRHRR